MVFGAPALCRLHYASARAGLLCLGIIALRMTAEIMRGAGNQTKICLALGFPAAGGWVGLDESLAGLRTFPVSGRRRPMFAAYSPAILLSTRCG